MKKNDVYLIICILVVCGGIALITNLVTRAKTTDAAVADVTIDGSEYGRFPLDVDTEETIRFEDGSYNTLTIHDGICDISEASCPDQICVNHMPIQYNGQNIVCLPNKLVVTIENGEEDDIDGMTH